MNKSPIENKIKLLVSTDKALVELNNDKLKMTSEFVIQINKKELRMKCIINKNVY